MQNLTINAGRLWDSIHETARFGACDGGGVDRLTLTDEDKRVRDWFCDTVEALGCTVTVDEVGNMFAHRPGKRDDLDPIAIGSHLDTQPTGGKFDGILGVLAGIEILRTLDEAGYITNAPLEIVNWTNEEGTRFSPAMLCSGVFAGVFPPDYAWSRTDRDGIRFDDALDRIGYRGTEKAGGHRLGAMFELHIEQGPILEAENCTIGVVTGVQGARWYDVRLAGSTGHTGATPMRLRRDALVGASELVLAVQRIAQDHGPEAVASVGRIDVAPNSRNVVPGEVSLSVDLRHPDDVTLARMAESFEAELGRIADHHGLERDLTPVWDSPAVRFAPELIARVEAGAEQAGLRHRRLVSGAGHDAAYIARVTPTTMVFVPCLGGVSHNVAESTTLDECRAGAQTLLNAVIAHDNSLID
jgi:N-carbamoyl-L-amino-acid hydrolase